MIFNFPNLHFKKFEIKKFESIKFFKIYYDFIKNNSYINLGDGNHIEIVWSCRNSVKTHNVSYIPLKILSTGRPIDKILIKYNNNLEKTMKKKRS